MKIIFLDIDGVLNCSVTKDRCGVFIGIEDSKVMLLKQVVDATDAKIVLSSTWRLGYTRYGNSLEGHHEYLNEKLSKQGLEIYSQTEELSKHGDLRGKEINKWLQEHDDIEAWVVLDDEYFIDFNMYDIPAHLVKTQYYSEHGGLTLEHIQEAIKILNGGSSNDS